MISPGVLTHGIWQVEVRSTSTNDFVMHEDKLRTCLLGRRSSPMARIKTGLVSRFCIFTVAGFWPTFGLSAKQILLGPVSPFLRATWALATVCYGLLRCLTICVGAPSINAKKRR